MNVLVVTGSCLQQNSSANLCHSAYITGLINLGYKVDLVSVDSKDYKIDENMKINGVYKSYTYYGKSIYEKISSKLNDKKLNNETVDSLNNDNQYLEVGLFKIKKNNKKSMGNTLNAFLKSKLLGIYGVHGTTKVWYKNARHFKSIKKYDYIISLSYPPISHLLVWKLLQNKNIIGDKWIQIWEDPWYGALRDSERTIKIYKEEEKILSCAEMVLYVSPITLNYQKELFPKYKNKMFWKELPYYYKIKERNKKTIYSKKIYGYFGDYSPNIRNLKPFYECAKELNISVNICGNPSDLFIKTDNINIHPRLGLEELSKIENKTNVLVFLCNLKNGQIPGKLYQYSATDKIILFILDGTKEEKIQLKNHFEKFNRYVFCDNTKDSITEAINKIETNNIKDIENNPLDCFNPETIIKEILDIYERKD